MQAEASELQADDEAIICASCCIFDSIMRRRESSMDQQLLAELPALLMRAISSCAHEPRLMLEALHCLDSLRGVSDSAKQQVLHSLTPANTEAFLDGILSLLEDEERLDPNFIEGVSDTQGSLLTHFLCKQRLALLFEETRLLFQLMSRTCQMCKVACEHIPRQSKFCTADYTVI